MGSFNIEAAKVFVIKDGLQLVANWGISLGEVECGALDMIKGLSSSSLLVGIGLIFYDVKHLLSFVSCDVWHFIP